MPEKQTVRIGYLYVVLSALFWSMSGNAAKFLFNSGISAFQLVQLRTTIASVILVLSLFAVNKRLLGIRYKDLPQFVALGAVLSVMLFTYLYAVSSIPVAVAVLLQYQAPALIAIYLFFFRKEMPSISTFLAIGFVIAGCYFMVGLNNFNFSGMDRSGIIAGLASAVALAVYSVLSENKMQRYSAWTVLAYALSVSAVIWNIIVPPFSAFSESHSFFLWGWILFICIFGTALPFGLYNEGVKRIYSTHASITATLEPVMAAVIAYVVLHEVMTPLQMAGGSMVIVSVVILQIRNR